MAARRLLSEATKILRALHRRGMTDQQIARQLERNSSYIYQVRVGKKPGRNLVAALRELRAGRTPPKPPRRLSKAHTRARVRTGRLRTPAGREYQEYGVSPKELRKFLRALRGLARRGKYVSLKLLYEHVRMYHHKAEIHHEWVVLFGRGGWLAQQICDIIDGFNSGDELDAVLLGLRWLAMQRPDVEDVGELLKIALYVL